MRIVHLVKNDSKGGAAKGAIRLNESLVASGIDSRVLVDVKFLDNNPSFVVKGPILRILRRIMPVVENRILKFMFNMELSIVSTMGIKRRDTISNLRRLNPDIIHVHWPHGLMAYIPDLLNIGVPIFWTLHDSWLLTGGCHLPNDCSQLSLGCLECPLAKNIFAQNVIRNNWNKKKKYLTIKPIHVITLSNWMYQRAIENNIVSGSTIKCLPNPLNTLKFAHSNQLKTKKNRIVFGYGAMGSLTDKNKGFDLLKDAIDLLEPYILDKIEFLIYGNKEKNIELNFKCNYHVHGYIASEGKMVSHYQSIDYTIVPSRLENLSYTIMESLSCGVPVICYDVGGNSDLVKDGLNGYLIEDVSAISLAKQIAFCVSSNEENRLELSKNSRDWVVDNYSYEKIAREYLEVYRSISSQ